MGDKIDGNANTAGKATGNEELEAKGDAQQIKGSAQSG